MFKHQRVDGRVKLLQCQLPDQFAQLYNVAGNLLEELIELRNEVIHPAHLATGTPDNWPAELRRTKARGILQSSEGPGDYLFLEQMKSLRLLDWAMGVVGQLQSIVLRHHGRIPATPSAGTPRNRRKKGSAHPSSQAGPKGAGTDQRPAFSRSAYT